MPPLRASQATGLLRSHLDEGSWLTLPATPGHVFRGGTDDLWKVLVQAINARKLSKLLGLGNLPTDPRLN